MKALRLYGPKDIRIEEVPVPAINENEILLKVKAAAFCGTDVRMWQYGYPGVDESKPLTLGHEFAGVIEKVGHNVPFYQPGMNVALQPNIGCGLCDRCVAGNFHLCDNYRAFGINMDGAFADYVVIPEDAITRGNITVLSDTPLFAESAIIEPLSCAYSGFTKMQVEPGDYALVVGAGPIGVMHVKLLHLAGAKVLLNDLSEERLAYCKSILPYLETYAGDDLPGAVEAFTSGKGLDIAITANPAPSVQAAVLPLMNYGGRVNFFGGIPKEKQPVPIDTNLIHYRELIVTGSTRSSIAHYRRVVNLVESGLLDISDLITDRYSIEEAETAIENAKAAKGIKHIIEFN